jgi:tetratricopeptide (TPR) repeat protein
VRPASGIVLEDYLLLGAAVGLPWIFGGVEMWAQRTAALALVGAAVVALWRSGWAGLGLDRRSRWLLPALLLGLWAALQLAPLPGAVLARVSPGAHRLFATTFPGYADRSDEPIHEALERRALERVPEAAATAPRELDVHFESHPGGRWSGWHALSLHPAAGQERAFWFLALLAGFLVARRRASEPGVADTYRKGLFALFFLLAAFGLIYAAMPNGKLYWVRGTLYPTRIFGPFVNPTNFGALMELAVPWLCGYTVLAWQGRSKSRRLLETRVPIFAAASVLCFLAGLATASKGAAILIGASVAILALALGRGLRTRLGVLLAVLLVGAALSVALLESTLGQRVRDLAEATGGQVEDVDRLVAWRAALPVAREYLWTGIGFGATGDAFGGFLPPGEAKRWEHLHNDYLELALEGGVVAVGLVVWLAIGFWRRTLGSLGDRASGRVDPAALGAVLGLAAMSAHALFDFNHQVPADALLFTVCAALAVGRFRAEPKTGETPRRASGLSRVLAVALLLVFGARAAMGWYAGTAHSAGRSLANAERYAEALPLLERGAIGPDRAANRWLAGTLRLNLLQQAQASGTASEPELSRLLGESYRDQTEAISISPASGWYWAALADVYHQAERTTRYARGRPLELVGQDPWAAVGRAGRVAIGMLRIAIEREPTQFVFHDQLAFAMFGYGLRRDALEVVRESARVQPNFEEHYYLRFRPVPRDLLDAFAESARSALGAAPLLREAHHRLALAKVELRRGRPEVAEADLRAVFGTPTTGINRADAWYNLGEALAAQQRYPEAVEAYVLAEPEPVFHAPGLAARARIAERMGYLDVALSLLRQARRLAPNDLSFALTYARVARKLGQPGWAEEALRWAALVHREDPRPLEELERLLREKGDHAGADELKRMLESRARLGGAGS